MFGFDGIVGTIILVAVVLMGVLTALMPVFIYLIYGEVQKIREHITSQ
jgi:hypothetical protein